MTPEQQKQRSAEVAMKYVEDGQVIGVGTGSTVNLFIPLLAKRKHDIEGAVSSSQQTTELLKQLGIRVLELNDAGDLWILGYKTERGGTLLDTRGRGRSEILGGFSYTTTAGKLSPMFVNDNSSVFAFFAEVCYNGDPFATLISEKRGEQVKTVKKGEGATLPYIGVTDLTEPSR